MVVFHTCVMRIEGEKLKYSCTKSFETAAKPMTHKHWQSGFGSHLLKPATSKLFYDNKRFLLLPFKMHPQRPGLSDSYSTKSGDAQNYAYPFAVGVLLFLACRGPHPAKTQCARAGWMNAIAPLIPAS